MPKMVLLAQYLSINANVLNTFTKKAELTTEVEDKDVTTYASLGWKEVLGGLKSGEVGCEFLQDFAATQLDAIMWPLLGTVVPFEVRADQPRSVPPIRSTPATSSSTAGTRSLGPLVTRPRCRSPSPPRVS